MQHHPAHARAAVVLLWSLVVTGCGLDLEQATRQTLAMTQLSVTAGWDVAIEHQRTAELLVIAEGAQRAAGQDQATREAVLAEVQAELSAIRARHHAWYAGFRLVRSLHTGAVRAFEAYTEGSGTREALMTSLAALMDAWADLQALLPGRSEAPAPGGAEERD